MYNIIADLHTHTSACSHAFNTIEEMVKSASDIGLFAIGITDHYGTMLGCPKREYFESILTYPMYMNGVRVLKGVEANIITPKGDIDCEDNLLSKLEWVVASIHDFLMEGRNENGDYTDLWFNIAHNPNVNVIGHSGSPDFIYDYEKVIPEFAKYGKLVEINSGSFRSRKQNTSNCIKIAEVCKKYNVQIVVNSDSHCCADIKRINPALEMLKEIDFPEELIVNSSIKRLTKYFDENGIKY